MCQEGWTIHRRSLSVARPSGRPNLALASIQPCGVPTFLDGIARKRTAATRSPHHCAADPMPQCESCVANEFVVDEGIGGRRLHHNARPDAVEVCGTSFDLNL